MSTVVAVQTRGCESMSFWTTQYRLELSQDCVTFSPVLDCAGMNVVNYYCFSTKHKSAIQRYTKIQLHAHEVMKYNYLQLNPLIRTSSGPCQYVPYNRNFL